MNNEVKVIELLKDIIKITNTQPQTISDKVINKQADQALALCRQQPCKTCGGSGKVPWTDKTGEVASTFMKKKCPACKGTGIEPDCQQPEAGESKTDILKCFGYAIGRYGNTCHTCKKLFEGDRRAITCKNCATEMAFANTCDRLNGLDSLQADLETERQAGDAMLKTIDSQAAELDKFRKQKICKHSLGENLCNLLKPLNEQGIRQGKQIIKLQARIKGLEEAIEWAVERMDEEPAKEDLKQALEAK